MIFKKCFAFATIAVAISLNAEPAKITVDVAHPVHAISPTLWGIFFEDINMSADGGIYPEMVRNRSFEDAEKPESWNFSSNPEGKCQASVVTANGNDQAPLNPYIVRRFASTQMVRSRCKIVVTGE